MCSMQQCSFKGSSSLLRTNTFRTEKYIFAPFVLRISSSRTRKYPSIPRAVCSVDEIPPNALRRRTDRNWRGGFSLGVDLGLSRTGVALSKGFSVRPLTVLSLRGQKLELRLLEIAEMEEVDEFIIGLPKSSDGKETVQSNKVRSVAGRLAVRAAERGWRVYVLDEHGTSSEASDRMIVMGLSKNERKQRTDAYAAVILLERYFSTRGVGAEIILPKCQQLQEKIKKGSPLDPDFSPGKSEEHFTF
ncbi:PREDICTED: uncharacterized protein LOC104809455 [Tarenaya hassleriana]|uniref:uncharacterized protein LOC104809455 n=1 Tax=Tarenaya hassleriana TaxID=28532 RepID=UPI00053C29D8|nr:PREDICTED: uncharacterized protein LOC104809455 [Tarenaya hassleriana]XP_010533766.1 PREDICTED: uncharacterized protein LOC104809455 [Tarenaya hassleriana]